MRELQEIKQDKLEVSATKPIQKQRKLIGSIKPHRGHTCFELNVATGEVLPAQFTSTNANFISGIKGERGVIKRIDAKDGYWYATALNLQNAQKKFIKMWSKQLSNNALP